ncbi:MAG: FAD:protein FMN transferase [Planctomycetia bacterium]
MTRKVYLTLCGLAALIAASCHRPEARQPVRVTETRRHMGVPWTITAYDVDQPKARDAIASAHDEVARLEPILSDYDPASELSRLSRQAPTSEPVRVGEDLWRVLCRAIAVRDASDGAFDPTVGPLTSLWRQARRTGVLPTPEKRAAAMAAVGPESLTLHPDRQAVSLLKPGMRLDLGGIGMGDAIDRAIAILREHGITAAMVDASGDIAVIGAPPGNRGWRIALAPMGPPGDPEEDLMVADAAVTTSGDAFQSVTIDGVRYSHVVDPRTGLGVVGPAAVTVVAPDGTTADAVATAANVLGPERGMRFIEDTHGCAARFLWQTPDGRFHEDHSTGWRGKAFSPAPAPSPVSRNMGRF